MVSNKNFYFAINEVSIVVPVQLNGFQILFN